MDQNTVQNLTKPIISHPTLLANLSHSSDPLDKGAASLPFSTC